MSLDQAIPCRWCSHIHGDICPHVKALEFAEDGVTVTRVEFMTPNDHPPIDSHGVKP